MKYFGILLILTFAFPVLAQKKKEKFPSYFGLQFRPVFPTKFIGNPVLNLASAPSEQVQYTASIRQQMGFSFGATVRAGVTKLIAIETGINFTRRNFDLDYEIEDSSLMVSNSLGFINYDIPINALFYIQLADKWFMNASLGVNINFSPTDVRVADKPSGNHEFIATGLVRQKFNFGMNANMGFEFRTKKAGFFYLGGSGSVPFSPLFDIFLVYKNQGYQSSNFEPVDGSFLAIDIKYFFPIIKNKGKQFKEGPIDQ